MRIVKPLEKLVMLMALAATPGLASTASANSISMIWISTSGPGVGVGTTTLTGVNPGDTAVLEIRVTATNLNAVAVSYGYSTSVIDAPVLADVAVCPAGLGNPFGPGVCGSLQVGGFGSLLTPSAGLTATGGGSTSAGALAGALAGQTSGTFALAHITFTATGPGTTGAGFYRPGLDGLSSIQGAFSTPAITSGSITVVPEPGTIALLVLGIGALAVAGRRR